MNELIKNILDGAYVFVLGVFFALWMKANSLVIKRFFKRYLVRKYWSFVVPFLVILGISYLYIYNKSSHENIDVNLSILNNWATIIFAVFVGWYAFRQLGEMRLEKLKEAANNYNLMNMPLRALEAYKEAYSINPKDPFVLSDLLELFLITRNFNGFDEKIGFLEKDSIELNDKRGQIICFYLNALSGFLKGHMNETREKIKKCVDFIAENSNSSVSLSWTFKTLKDSDTYKKIPNNPDKQLFNNFMSYLEGTMPLENRTKFEEHNYYLN